MIEPGVSDEFLEELKLVRDIARNEGDDTLEELADKLLQYLISEQE